MEEQERSPVFLRAGAWIHAPAHRVQLEVRTIASYPGVGASLEMLRRAMRTGGIV